MRLVLALLAFAGTITAASASPSRDDRYFVAWGATSLDVTRAVAQQRALVRKSRPRRGHARRAGRRAPVPLPRPRPPAAASPMEHVAVVGNRWGQGEKAENLPVSTGAVIGGRPEGCPHRFCACALSLRLFGRIIPMLNLAANWLTFPRAAPAPGMVAARRGHVFQLLAHSGGSRWRVWDANSGRGRIRIHDRSIAGYVIVHPDGQHLSARRHRGRR